jgi:predicted Na+-dependent transporter
MHTKINFSNFIPLLAIPVVIALPNVGLLLSPHTVWILGALLFVSFISAEMSQLWQSLKKPTRPLFFALTVLVLTPLVMLPLMQQFLPEYFVGAMIFMLLPSALSSPAVAGIYGGNVSLATVNTILSNMLSPFTITLFFAFFLGSEVTVDLASILTTLCLIIFIPFALGLLANRFAQPVIKKTKRYFRFASLLLIFFFFFGALAPYVNEMTANFSNTNLWLAVATAYLVLFLFAKLSVLYCTNRPERVAVESNLMFLNVGLGVVIAQNYFGPVEMLFIIFCEIVWVSMVTLFNYLK